MVVVVVEVVVVEVESVKGSSVSISATTGSIGKRNKLIDDAVVCSGTVVGAVTGTDTGDGVGDAVVCSGTDVRAVTGTGTGDGVEADGYHPGHHFQTVQHLLGLLGSSGHRKH